MKKPPLSSAIILLFALSSLKIIAQQPTTEWVARYSGASPKGNGTAKKIAVDANNNIYVTGVTGGGKTGNDITTIKYNTSGQQIWTATYNGPGNDDDFPYAMTLDSAGNIYVAGRTMTATPKGTYDWITIKYSPAGVQQWAVRYNGSANSNDVAKDVQVDAKGNVFVTGDINSPSSDIGNAFFVVKYNSSGGFVRQAIFDSLPNDNTLTNNEDPCTLSLSKDGSMYVSGRCGPRMITVKFDSSGQKQWSRIGGGNNGRKIIVDSSNNIVVTGWGSRTIKYNPAGDVLWDVSFPGGDFDYMAVDKSDNVYITGSTRTDGTKDDFRTIKYNSNGIEQWNARYNGTLNGIDLVHGIVLDKSGSVYVTGYTEINDGTRYGSPYYGTIKYDNAGNQQWLMIFDITTKTGGNPYGIALDSFGSVYVTGASGPGYATVKYSQTANRIVSTKPASENFIAQTHLTNYPNPFSKSTSIEYQLSHSGNVTLSIVDITGRVIATLVDEKESAGSYKLNFQAGHLSAGNYFCRLQFDGIVETRKLIIAR